MIDERPIHMRTDSADRTKWKAIGGDTDSDRVKSPELPEQQQQKTERKTLAGKKAGLSDAKEIKKELVELKKRNEKAMSKLNDDISGKNAKTVFRDRKTGKIREIEKELKEKQEKDEQNAIEQAEKQAVYDRWSKGLVQREEQLEKMESELHEMSKPLARYKDDDDLDELLRNQDRQDDPMLAEIMKKREEEKSQDPNYKKFPKYRGPPPPPNRFDIKPGYRWDGVDRSNGYEAKYFAKKADREAIQEEAYHWSVQDM